jgi:hypothetical protein
MTVGPPVLVGGAGHKEGGQAATLRVGEGWEAVDQLPHVLDGDGAGELLAGLVGQLGLVGVMADGRT